MNIIHFYAQRHPILGGKALQLTLNSGDISNISQYEPTVIQVELDPAIFPNDNYTPVFYLSSPIDEQPDMWNDKSEYRYKMHLRSIGEKTYQVVLNDYITDKLVIGDDNRESHYYLEVIIGYDVENPDYMGVTSDNTMQWCTSDTEEYNADDIRALFKYI